jgi:hypothetical protein
MLPGWLGLLAGNKKNRMGMTPRERFLTAIRGGEPDRLALTIWHNKLPGGDIDEQLLKTGVCVIVKSSVWRMEYQGVMVEYEDEKRSEIHTRRTITYHTRHGKLREVRMLEPGTSWIREFMFKSPDDYNALETIISSREYFPDYQRFLDDESRFGDQSVARPSTIHSPFHELIYEYMGMEAFSMELAMNPERLFRLEKTLKADWKQRISVLESSPARYAVIEGNTDPRVVGPQMFREHHYPFIQEACRHLHENMVLAGAHLDSNNAELAPLIASTDLDLIESFTPPPDCDMSIPEARRTWPGKALQVHFPSSIHLFGKERIRSYCESLVKEMEGKKAIAIGVSEDVPDRGYKTLLPMFKYLEEFSRPRTRENPVRNHAV